ncbi:MAG: signal recognition particle protein, partial [Acidimicrobiia bacterium]
SLSGRFEGIFDRLRAKGRLREADVDASLREVRLALLEADVNVGVVKDLLGRIRERAVGTEITKSLTPGQQVIKIVHDELVRTLGGEATPLAQAPKPPLVILVVGLQGSGKTTTAAKLAVRLKARKPLLVAADLQRPAAVEQLAQLGEAGGIDVFQARGSKPVKVVRDAARSAAQSGHGVLIVDTAGRLQIDDELMGELSVLQKTSDPDEVLLVVDAMTGQEAVSVAQGFSAAAEVTGFVLSKLDGDARGGAAISVREVTGKPVKFAGIGEKLTDLEVFHPDRIASRILGMGDVLSLIERAEAAFDEEEATKVAAKMRDASFTLEDFLDQFSQVRKMGSMGELLAMLPGAAPVIPEVDDHDLRRVEAIIRSMTPAERRDPKIINGSRRRRIAAGSGTSVQDVNNLLKQFTQTQRMMKSLAQGRGFPDLAGLIGRK